MNKLSNLGIIAVKISTASVISDDIILHIGDHVWKVFIKDFKEDNYIDDLKKFTEDVCKLLKHEGYNICKLLLHHTKHDKLLFSNMKESLVSNGLENVLSSGISYLFAIESLPLWLTSKLLIHEFEKTEKFKDFYNQVEKDTNYIIIKGEDFFEYIKKEEIKVENLLDKIKKIRKLEPKETEKITLKK